MPLTPFGHQKFKFGCGRKAGYETVVYKLPKSIIAERGAVVQLEFETEYGTVVQCSDMIV